MIFMSLQTELKSKLAEWKGKTNFSVTTALNRFSHIYAAETNINKTIFYIDLNFDGLRKLRFIKDGNKSN